MSLPRILDGLVPRHKRNRFIQDIPAGARLLDVGCGNHSPSVTKAVNPGLRYYGLDIENDEYEMNTEDHAAAEELHFVHPDKFAEGIGHWGTDAFDRIIASHVLEHVNDFDATVTAIGDATKAGGLVYVAFPSNLSVENPSRGGSLNYLDDKTHKRTGPPSVDRFLRVATESGLTPVFVANPYTPLVRKMIGIAQEPISRRRNQTMSCTWALWAFESVFVLRKG